MTAPQPVGPGPPPGPRQRPGGAAPPGRPVVAGARLDEDVGEGVGRVAQRIRLLGRRRSSASAGRCGRRVAARRGGCRPTCCRPPASTTRPWPGRWTAGRVCDDRPRRGPAAGRPGRVPALVPAGMNDLDLDRILDAYATPCFVVKGGRVLHHQDDAAKARYFGELLDGNRRQGPHRWDRATSSSARWAATARWSPSAGPAGGPTARPSGSSSTPTCWPASGGGGGSSATWSTKNAERRAP
jgi:hypothetical protein